MTHNTIRLIAAGVAIATATLISLATEPSRARSGSTDPSVPPAWEVIHANDGRSQGNVPDMTY
jgi:hypothetical protein